MTNTATISPTQVEFYAGHTSEALHNIVSRYTNDSMYMASNGATEMADEAMKIANTAWFALTLRGEA